MSTVLTPELDEPEIVEVEEKYSLQAALRDAAALGVKQAHGKWRGQNGESCALTAIYDQAKMMNVI